VERELVGTVAIAVVASLVAAPFFIPWKSADQIRLLKNQYPKKLVVAASDSVGENDFAFGFVVNRDFADVRVSFRFLYGENLTESKEEKVNRTLYLVAALQRMIPPQSQIVRTGQVNYNGTEANYTLYDFAGSPTVPPESNLSTFLIIRHHSTALACFSGVADLFPRRSAGSLIAATIIRSGNRTHYIKRPLDGQAGLPITSLPRSYLAFSGVRSGETIEISYRSDAFYAHPKGGGAVQIITVDCDGTTKTTIFNFMR